MPGHLLDGMDGARARTLEMVASLSQRQLDFAPGPGRWSIGEVLDHLLAVDRLYREEIAALVALARAGRRPYLRRTFRDINIAPLFLPDALLPWLDLPLSLLNRVTPDAVRDVLTRLPIVPSRRPDRGAPRARRPGPELRRELATSLAGLRALVDANADLDFRTLVLEHPVTGVSHVPRLLAFVAEHERRHQRQIDGIRRHRQFPWSDRVAAR
jgi:uncharacterized damage-inducible protein DinB